MEVISVLPGQQLGWVLLHSLWQYAVVGLFLWGILAILRRLLYPKNEPAGFPKGWAALVVFILLGFALTSGLSRLATAANDEDLPQEKTVNRASAPTEFEGDFAMDQDLALGLSAAGGGKLDIFRLRTVRFEKKTDRLCAELEGATVSWPKAQCSVAVAVFDAAGKLLAEEKQLVENSDDIAGKPAISPFNQSIRFDPKLPVHDIKRFYVWLIPPTVMEGDFAVDKDLVVYVGCAASRRPNLVQLKTIRFAEKAGRLTADLKGEMFSWPKGRWLVEVAVLDAAGKWLAKEKQPLENSGVVMSKASISWPTLSFVFDPKLAIPEVKRYRVSLIPRVDASMKGDFSIDADLPVKLNAAAGDKQDILQLDTIRFAEKAGQLSAEIKGQMVSWPKGHWSVEAVLLDDEGKELAKAETSFENSGGSILGVPAIGPLKLAFDFGDADQAIPTAKSFRVKITDIVE